MAVKMRLRREGKKKQPYYRIVVADVRSPRDGRFIEDLGYYQPLAEPSSISIDRERALYWLRNGVQASDAVVNLLRIEGIWDEFRPGDPGKERSVRNRARAAEAAKRKESPRAEATAPAESATPEAEAPSSGTEPAPVAEADSGTVEQAREEVTQRGLEPIEDAGALEEGEQP